MTGSEQKMKKYTRAVERRLNLPKDVKDRVMSDFLSSIQARQEAGMSNAQIVAELGTPKKAAADLNEQMKEYAYRKSPWRFGFLALAVLSGGWLVLYSFMKTFGFLLDTLKLTFYLNPAASIGIIGGADGPTAVFVTTSVMQSPGFDWEVAAMVVILIVGIWGFLRLKKCRQK